jgi:hypothetical protein
MLIPAASVQRRGGRHRGSWQVQPQCPLPLASWQPGQSAVSTGTVSLLSHGLQPGPVWVWRGDSKGLVPQQKKGTFACIICQVNALLWSGFHHNVKRTCPIIILHAHVPTTQHLKLPCLSAIIPLHLLRTLLLINDRIAKHLFMFSAHTADQQSVILRIDISTA